MAARPILLDKPVTLNQLSSGEGFTFQTNFDDVQVDASESDDDDYSPQLSGQLETVNLEDEDLYEYNPSLFKDILLQMAPVDTEGKVMKRVFRPGHGQKVPQHSKVTYHYKAYLELEPIAFDSTYHRKKPEISKLHHVLLGLGVALQSMKINEKAQFLIQPEWAYGVMGIQPSIPPNSTILFEVEVLSFVPIDVDDEDEDLTESHDYTKNYEKAKKLCEEAKHLIHVEKKEKPAIRNYNAAIQLLCNIGAKDEQQEKEYVNLLVKLYKNIAIAHNRLEHWKKACINCTEAYKLCNTFHRQVDAKVYYAHAKALFGLKEYVRADEQLRKAAKLASYDRPNADVMKLYRQIQDARAKSVEEERALAKSMMKTPST